MNKQEAVAYIEEWDVTEAAKVLKWYEEGELLRPCDCDTIVEIETENLQAENAELRDLLRDMFLSVYFDHASTECMYRDCMRDLGIEVDE